jgi:hypothetical protein
MESNVECRLQLSTTLSMSQPWCSDVALGRRRCNKAVNKASRLLRKYCADSSMSGETQKVHT